MATIYPFKNGRYAASCSLVAGVRSLVVKTKLLGLIAALASCCLSFITPTHADALFADFNLLATTPEKASPAADLWSRPTPSAGTLPDYAKTGELLKAVRKLDIRFEVGRTAGFRSKAEVWKVWSLVDPQDASVARYPTRPGRTSIRYSASQRQRQRPRRSPKQPHTC